MRHVIIGNSAAGIRAAETLRSLDPAADITMIDEDKEAAYSRCMLPDFLAGTLNERGLAIRPHDFYTHNRINTIFGSRAVAVNPAQHKVELERGVSVSYGKLLIATGASSFMPPVPGIDGNNVFGFRNLNDARGILQAVAHARRVIIVGGGFVGLEAAYALYQRGLEVTIIEKMPQILPQQMDAAAAKILLQDIQAEGIRVLLGRGIKEIAPPNLWQRLFGRSGSGVILEGGERLKAEVILVATGTRANVDLVKDTGIIVNRGILVKGFMETNQPDIYAASDVA